ncbi:MAG: MarR family winged helix-turn-helix transcriptional regulator [Alphaproteobacteria bacterium]
MMADQMTASPTTDSDAETQRTAALSPDACLLRHVARTSRAVVAAYDPALAPYGLTGHQFNLMMTLRNMGPLTVGALADVLGMDASGVPRAIRPLIVSGQVASNAGQDRRQRLLSLTPQGRSVIDTATPAWERVQAELVDVIGPALWMSIAANLRTVRQAASSCSTRKT